MLDFLRLNHDLEEVRVERQKAKMIGPKVIILGPTDTGKTSLARILINYAIK